MRMYTRVFNDRSELDKYVNENGIKQSQIVSIVYSEHEYTLWYYAE